MVERIEEEGNTDEGVRKDINLNPQPKNSPFVKSRELGAYNSMPV